ncbi:MAG: MBL fold metallo-hydrolase [Candidatus Methylomirabilales bacterium]
MGNVTVQFLGSGDAFGSGGRHHTCFFVDSRPARFLIDCGPSSLVAMKAFGVDPSLVDIVLVTHLHGDHFGGLPFIIRETQMVSRRTRPLVIAGPVGLQERMRDVMEAFFPGSTRVEQTFRLEFMELRDEQPNTVGPLLVTPYRVVHTSGTEPRALRVECDGKVISYSGDTEWTPALIAVAEGADLFICEAYTFEKKVKNHMDYRTLLEHRGELGCRRLILTHMSDDMLKRLHTIDSESAEDGKRIVI